MFDTLNAVRRAVVWGRLRQNKPKPAVDHHSFAEHAEIVADVGQDPAEVVAASQSQAIKDRLRAQTEEAKRLGIFGAPSFTIGDELFWGNDRLGQAIAWACGLR